jgi:hypothetical protein
VTDSIVFYTVLSGLLDAVNSRLLGTAAGQPERVCVYPGLIAWDDCQCGQLAGAISRIFLSDNFPLQHTGRGQGETTSCQPAYKVAEMVVSLMRCAPQPQGTALAPTCEALAAAAQTWAIDAGMALSGVLCTLDDYKDAGTIIDYRVDNQVPAGPEGACVGTDIHFLVGLEL